MESKRQRLRQARGGALVVLRTLWTLPTTLVGLSLALLAWPWGVRWQVREGVVECQGRGIALWVLQPWWRPGADFLAITFGDVILAVSGEAMDVARAHEHVHVRQAHRWGPFFIPAYLVASLWAFLRGGRAYRDNVFEREAYGS